jgi:hypothetical protein
MSGKSIIPSGYGDDNGDPKDLTVQTEKVGTVIEVGDMLEGPPINPLAIRSAEQSLRAFELAKVAYDKLTPEQRKATSVGALAIRLNDRLNQEASREAELRAMAAAVGDASLPHAVAAPAVAPRKAKKQRPNPSPVAEVTPVAVMNERRKAVAAVAARIDVEGAVSAAFDSLHIPGLAAQAFAPYIYVTLEYMDGANPVQRQFPVHWLTVYRGERDEVSSVSLAFDSRWGESPFDSLNIAFSPTETMRFSATDGTSEVVFEALRGKMLADLGAFSIATFTAVKL